MKGGVYERTHARNGRLLDWNAPAVLVDKVENLGPLDEPRITFNYRGVKETMPGTYLELSSKVHDNLANPNHRCFFQADVKHGYFNVILVIEDRHYFAFYIPGIGQLQPIRMPQGSRSAGFTMFELMNIALGPIPAPDAEPSLLYNLEDDDDPFELALLSYYADDIFGGALSAEKLYNFLEQHFFF